MDLIGIFEIIQSKRKIISKVGWSLLIFIFPVFGALIYYLCSNRNKYDISQYDHLEPLITYDTP